MCDKTVYPNCQDFKTCSNCEYSDVMLGVRLCRWHEAYVSPAGSCSWWVKKFEKEVKQILKGD